MVVDNVTKKSCSFINEFNQVGCVRPRYDESIYCIGHENNPDKDLDLFLKQLELECSASDSAIDFSGFVFPRSTPPDLFQKLPVVKEISFGQAEFLCDVYFKDQEFQKKVSFIGAHFNEKTDFEVLFRSKADFSFSVHRGNARFRSFFSEADFTAANFLEEAKFDLCGFKKSVFKWAHFRKNVTFDQSRFVEKADFDGVNFYEAVSFDWASIENGIEFSSNGLGRVFNGELGFSNMRLEPGVEIIFSSCDLSKAYFFNTDVSAIFFKDVDWATLGRWPFNRQCVFEDPTIVGVSLFDYPKRKYALLEELYRQLKKNYESHSNYIIAGDFHAGEMEMRRRRFNPKNSNWWLYSAYKLLSLYGERWFRPLLIGLITMFVFVFIEMLIGIKIGDRMIEYHLFEGSMNLKDLMIDIREVSSYLLQVAFLQRPSDIDTLGNRFFIMLWGIAAPIFIALSILAMRRRFKR